MTALTAFIVIRLLDGAIFGVVVALAGFILFGAGTGHALAAGLFVALVWCVCSLIADQVRWLIRDHRKRILRERELRREHS